MRLLGTFALLACLGALASPAQAQSSLVQSYCQGNAACLEFIARLYAIQCGAPSNPCPPPAPPTPVAISFDPPTLATRWDAPIGYEFARVIVKMSDGSPFNGSLGFAPPNYDAGGCIAIANRTVVLACQLPNIATIIHGTITAR